MRYTAAVITVSDKGFRGERADTSGPALCELLKRSGWKVEHTSVVPDELDLIREELIRCADEKRVQLVLTTGGTGFSPRDVTPEATLAVVERETRGIPELMRAESQKITPRGCLSRAAAGIRGSTLIINLPGSEKAAVENLLPVLSCVEHGVDMLLSGGSADCAQESPGHCPGKKAPSLDAWLKEAKAAPEAGKVGMYLTHNGVVRETARARVRGGDETVGPVIGMRFSYDRQKVDAAVERTHRMDGIYYIRTWLNEGELQVGDDIMYVLIGGDTRPHTVDALQYLVGRIKRECVMETEVSEEGDVCPE